MQSKDGQLRNNRFFLFCFLAVGFAVLISNIAGKDVAYITTDSLLVILSGGLIVLSVIIAAGFRAKGDHGIAYIIFAGFALLWFIAELAYLQTDLAFHLLSFSGQDEVFYLGAYPFLFVFAIYYLKPFRLALSARLIAYAILATLVFLVPTLYSTYSLNTRSSIPEILWAAAYPIADAMILFPAVLGLALFFKGEVGLFWSFTCIAIILNIIADSGFFFSYIDKTAYSGNPINILYMWSYLLFAFGIYTHVKLFKKPKMKSFGNPDDLK